MTDAPTLAEWLLERIAEDEVLAKAALQDNPHRRGEWGWGAGDIANTIGDECVFEEGPWTVVAKVGRDYGAHIARHDPARVLAECAAHRRIVKLHVEAEHVCRVCQWDHDCDQPIYTHDDDPAWLYPCPTLRALASAYADADGFREEWR